MRDAIGDGRLSREMVDDVAALHRGRQRFAIQNRRLLDVDVSRDRLEIPKGARRQVVEDRALDQLDVDAVEVGSQSGRQVVEGDRAADVGVLDEGPAQVGADEPGTAGDEDPRPLHGLAAHGRRRP